MKAKNIRKLTIAGVLVAVAVVGSLFSIPVLGAKCSPVQHMLLPELPLPAVLLVAVLREDEALPFPLPAAVLVCLPAEVLLPLPE